MLNSFVLPFSYPVLFVDRVFDEKPGTLTELIDSSASRRLVAFVDEGVVANDPTLAARIRRTLDDRLVGEIGVVPGGERGKDGLAQVERCAAAMNDAKIDRHAYVLAIGGGAMLDVVGFAAAIVHRGVRLIRMPSTVLAQNDAGIGVKNGVNFFGKKNFLGSFAPPFAVINDFSLLRTLSVEQWRDGTAEAVKVALIRDRAFFEWIEANIGKLVERDADAFRYLIRRCAELHLQHITTSGDPFERGSSRPLDFGHWSAHKLESLSNYQISHGHAVAIGMALDMRYAARVNVCTQAVADRVIACIRRLGFPLQINVDVNQLLSGLAEFQEHLGGALSLAMISDIGEAVEVNAVDRAVMGECIRSIFES